MELEKLIEMLAKELKFPAVPLKDKNGYFQLKINPSTTIAIKELEGDIFIHGQILPLPKEGNKEALFIHIMKANLLGQGTGGATIGMDEHEKFLTLSQTLIPEVNFKKLYETLEDFINYMDYWKEEIPKLQISLL